MRKLVMIKFLNVTSGRDPREVGARERNLRVDKKQNSQWVTSEKLKKKDSNFAILHNVWSQKKSNLRWMGPQKENKGWRKNSRKFTNTQAPYLEGRVKIKCCLYTFKYVKCACANGPFW